MDVLLTTGTVQQINDKQITVSGEGAFQEVILNVDETTYVVTAKDGSSMDFSSIKKGDQIAAYYGPRLTRSLPPQGHAIALIVGNPENGAMYMKVATLETLKGGGVRALDSNKDRLVTILPEVFAETARIQEGSELLVWYQMMTLSLPGQANATKAVLLDRPVIQAAEGKLMIHGKITALQVGDEILKKNGTVYLPLRTIAEQLGYTVKWNEKARTIALVNGARTATLSVGSQEYGANKMRVRLEHVPIIVNGKTLVPVGFFTQVLEVTARIQET